MADEAPDAETLDEVSRKLGWDFARYGLRLPDDLPASAHEEYRAGLTKFHAAPGRHDRFVRKWLQLRASALRRQRIIDPGVTVRYLREIDVAVCPITLVKLTHAELTDSDWSIDRLNNDGAYAPQNLAVMCRKANLAKGAKSFEAVYELSNQEKAIDGLTPREWLRLACIMYCACLMTDRKLAKVSLPLATRLPPTTPRHSWYSLQLLLLETCSNARQRNTLIAALGNIARDNPSTEFLKLAVERLALKVKGVQYRYDALLDERIQSMLWGWLERLSEEQALKLSGYLQAATGGRRVSEEIIAGLAAKTLGYLSDRKA